MSAANGVNNQQKVIFDLIRPILPDVNDDMQNDSKPAPESPVQRTAQAFRRAREEQKDDAPRTPERAAPVRVAPPVVRRGNQHRARVPEGTQGPQTRQLNFGAPSSMAPMEVDHQPESGFPQVTRSGSLGSALFMDGGA